MFVNCVRLDGTIKRVAKSELRLRTAVFALLVQQESVLLLRLKASGKYHLPGGGIELGELMAEALQREVREETGLAIQVGPLAFVEELFFYYDPSQTAYHGLQFYLEASPLSLSLTSDDKVQDGSAEQPRWVPIAELQPNQFQSSGAEIIDHCRRLANSQINKGRKKRA